MTIIAGITDGTTCWIGADSGYETGGERLQAPRPKVFRTTAGNQEALVGVAGYYSLRQAVRWRLDLPPAPELSDDETWDEWAHDVQQRFTVLVVDAGYPLLDSDGDVHGALLVACGGRIWMITRADAFGQASMTIGTGDACCRGAMWAAAALGQAPAEALLLGLKAAVDGDVYCAPPFVVERLDPTHPPDGS